MCSMRDYTGGPNKILTLNVNINPEKFNINLKFYLTY